MYPETLPNDLLVSDAQSTADPALFRHPGRAVGTPEPRFGFDAERCSTSYFAEQLTHGPSVTV